ncbi:MAG: hypothetical protein IKR48_12190 [Kiritimatiellae bacterium]|nr:hypothetical protein [Kiritimatiellia bacterium]
MFGRFSIFVAVLVARTICLAALDPQTVLDQHQESVVASNQCIQVEGFVFLSVRMVTDDHDFFDYAYKTRFCDAVADAFLMRMPRHETLTPLLQHFVMRQYLATTKFPERVLPYELNCHPKDSAVLARVFGIPEQEFAAWIPDWKTVQETVCSPSRFLETDVNFAALMEIAPEELQIELRKDAVAEFLNRYGMACHRFCSDGLLTSFSPQLAGSVTQEVLRDARVSDLLFLLNEIPGDPRLLAALATKLDELGMSIMAQWLASRGGLEFIDPAATRQCREIVGKGRLFQMAPYRTELDFDQVRGLLTKLDFSGTPLEIYNRWRLPFPGGASGSPPATDTDFNQGQSRLAAGDTVGAYPAFLRSIARHISYKACELAGECAFANRAYHEAALLFLQALATHPADGYGRSWFFLTRIAKRVGDETAFRYCAEKVKDVKLTEDERAILSSECGIGKEDQVHL